MRSFLTTAELNRRLEAYRTQMAEKKLGPLEDSRSVRYLIAVVAYDSARDPDGDYTDTWQRVILPWVRRV